ncbi:MAG TPA: hypothetical protein VNZ45_11935, partial [Bacteroidia bacterium]|nr:hypothetical protein [Bacteroidia bacterium]
MYIELKYNTNIYIYICIYMSMSVLSTTNNVMYTSFTNIANGVMKKGVCWISSLFIRPFHINNAQLGSCVRTRRIDSV